MAAEKDSQFQPIRVSTLRGDTKIKFNAYVRVADRYILLCREGDSFEGERLERLRGKKLVRLYIPAAQFVAYEEYLSENIQAAFDESDKKPLNIRLQITHGLMQATTEDLMESPNDKTMFAAMKDRSEKLLKLLLTEPATLPTFLELKNVDYSVSHHAVNVASLSIAIANEMHFVESKPLKVVPMVIGALMHDIEHTYSNIHFSTPVSRLSKPEKVLHQKHAFAGYERLNQTGLFDPTALIVVSEHEEALDGSGPRGKRQRDLDDTSMVVAAANAFDHYLLYDKLLPKDALKQMLIDKMGVVHLEAMRALQAALKKHGII